METSKNVDKYFNLDEILRLDLDQKIKDSFKEKFGKTVYFDSNGTCKVGTLCGLEKNYQLSMIYYIIEIPGNRKMYVPIYKSITAV